MNNLSELSEQPNRGKKGITKKLKTRTKLTGPGMRRKRGILTGGTGLTLGGLNGVGLGLLLINESAAFRATGERIAARWNPGVGCHDWVGIGFVSSKQQECLDKVSRSKLGRSLHGGCFE